MRSFALLALLALPSMVSGALVPNVAAIKALIGNGEHNRLTSGDMTAIPGRFIISIPLEETSKRALGDGGALLKSYSALSKFNGTVLQEFSLRPDIFTGFSVKVSEDLTSDDILSTLAAGSQVWPVHQLPSLAVSVNARLGSSALTRLLNQLAAIVKRIRTAADYRNDVFGPHKMTGVDTLHNAGVLGSGVKVAVVDTGVDYTNPILGGCFGAGCQISFGYDFVGDDYNGGNTPVPDADPFADCTQHGTHVTGVIGALANDYGFTGVSPLATLGHYRIYGCNGGSTEDILIQAILRAVSDGVDVLSLSLTSNGGWMQGSALGVAVNNAAIQGTFVSVSTSNEGVEGMFMPAEPGVTPNGQSVGSVDVVELPGFTGRVVGASKTFTTLAARPYGDDVQRTLYFLTTNTAADSADACSALPAGTNLAGFVVVVQRGICPFTDKIANVVAAGGTILLIYNTEGGTTMPYIDIAGTGIDYVAGLQRADGLDLLTRWNANKNTKVTLPSGKIATGVRDIASGGTQSYFSSWGPSFDLYATPALSAPGGSILSTYPMTFGGVSVQGGTSDAAPFVAGAAALVLGVRGTNLTPLQVRSLLSTTASPVPAAIGSSAFSSVALTGAGLINANLAVRANAIISPSSLMLNDTANFIGTHTITIQNTGILPGVYRLSHVVAQTVTSRAAAGDNLMALTPPVIAGTTASVRFSQSTLIVLGRSSKTVTVTFTAPAVSADVAARWPVYSGFIRISGDVTYNVPYLGVANSMFQMPVLDVSATIYGIPLPLVYNNPVDNIQFGPATYPAGGVGPQIFFRLATGTRRLSLDVIPAETTFVPTLASEYNNPARMTKRSLEARQTRALYADAGILGTVYHDENVGRDQLINAANGYSDFEIYFNGQYTTPTGATVTAAPNTSYKLLIRALKIFGEVQYEDQYESWLSPAFSFV